MNASRCTDEQIITILREAETGPATVEAVCRKHAIAEATLYRWRSKYGGLEAADAARLTELERENARRKKLLADRDLAGEAGAPWAKEINANTWEAHRPGAALHRGKPDWRCNEAGRVGEPVRSSRLPGRPCTTCIACPSRSGTS